MKLTVVTPDKIAYEGEVSAVTVPGTLGSFQILNNHAPIVSTLEDGKVIIKGNGGEETFLIKGGVVEVKDNVVTVLAEGIV